MTKVTKQDVINDFKRVLQDFQLKYGTNEISRDLYRQISKYGSSYERFMSFSELKQTFSVDLPLKIFHKKRFIISTILPNSKVNKNFVSAMELYCKTNNAELILIPIRGVRNEVLFNEQDAKLYGKYFCTEHTFNSNLRLVNTGITANNKNPIQSIKELGHKNYSVIAGSTKQSMELIPSIHKDKVHLVYLTGTCSDIIYKKNVTGHINSENNTVGALVVEIQDDKIFYIRNVEWINGYFVDLNKAYFPNKVEKIEAEAIVAGDFHLSGDEDVKSLELLKQEIKFLKAKKLFIHDFCSHNTINHHEQDNWVKMAKMMKKFINLEAEHDYTARVFNRWVEDLKHLDFYIVKSNHDRWLSKYIGNRNLWIHDNSNALYAHTLCGYALMNMDPFELTMRHKIRRDIKIHFIQDKSFKIAGIELGFHGDIGNNGGKSSLRSLELSAGKCVVGHSHTPKILFKGFQVGTCTKLDLGYNVGGSSWWNGNVSIYKDGHRQMLLGVDYKIKL